MFEGSSVLWGANEDTYTVSVSKSMLKNSQGVLDELDNLYKAFRDGTYTDETFGLLELRIKTIQKAISEFLPPANGGHGDGSHVGSTNSEANIKLLQDLKQEMTWN